MPDIEGVGVRGRKRHHRVAQASNFTLRMLTCLRRKNLTILVEFEIQFYFADGPNVSARMVKLRNEVNWFHAYFIVQFV